MLNLDSMNSGNSPILNRQIATFWTILNFFLIAIFFLSENPATSFIIDHRHLIYSISVQFRKKVFPTFLVSVFRSVDGKLCCFGSFI